MDFIDFNGTHFRNFLNCRPLLKHCEMNDFEDVYDTAKDQTNGILRYYFMSKGNKEIVKVIG